MASNHHHPSDLDDESEETVSLCDLPIYGYETHYTTTTSDQDSMKDEEESFEFFPQEWLQNNQDSNLFPNKGIVFDKSLILPQYSMSRNTQESKKHDHASNKLDLDYGSSRNCESTSKHGTKRVLVPPLGSMKSRWYYHGFGLAGIPTEMDMSAIRSRQNRHRKSHSVGGQGGGGKEEGGGFRQGKGLGRLIREMICDGHTQANSMVKASLVYIPRV